MGKKINNYLTESWVSPKLHIGVSLIHGKGVITNDRIEKNEILIVWGGTIFDYEEIKAGKAKQHTMVGISENLYLGTRNNQTLTVDDYMNHSCEPNVWMMNEVTLIAKRHINSKEEITADYVMWLNDERYIMKNSCNCGSSLCRKTISGEDWKLNHLQLAYFGHFSPFINERIERLNK